MKNAFDERWNDRKLHCLNPAFTEAARINPSGAILISTIDGDEWYQLSPWSLACIILALEEEKPELLNKLILEQGGKTQF